MILSRVVRGRLWRGVEQALLAMMGNLEADRSAKR
jgi:hypothetical protein